MIFVVMIIIFIITIIVPLSQFVRVSAYRHWIKMIQNQMDWILLFDKSEFFFLVHSVKMKNNFFLIFIFAYSFFLILFLLSWISWYRISDEKNKFICSYINLIFIFSFYYDEQRVWEIFHNSSTLSTQILWFFSASRNSGDGQLVSQENPASVFCQLGLVNLVNVEKFYFLHN